MPDQEREKYLKEISLLHAENATLKEEVALMQSQLDWFKKQMFGRKTEQSTVIFEGGEQLSLMQDEKAVSEKTSAFMSLKIRPAINAVQRWKK